MLVQSEFIAIPVADGTPVIKLLSLAELEGIVPLLSRNFLIFPPTESETNKERPNGASSG